MKGDGGMRTISTSVALLGGLLAMAGPAFATETITYSYDELGRLLTASSSNTSTVNPNETVTIVVDKAGNRTTYTVTGA